MDAKGRRALQLGKQSTNTSGYVGVFRKAGRSRWDAQLSVNGRNVRLGSFDTKEEAARARDRAAFAAHGDKAVLNFPDEAGSAAA
jgi:hypothetical protein